MKKKGFTFVELMMVLAVLGAIAALTLPLLKNLVNKDDIYRAYLKKSIADVTDAVAITDLQSRNFAASNCTIGGVANSDCSVAFNTSRNLRDVFATFAFKGETCGPNPEVSCDSTIGDLPGITLGKILILFDNTADNVNGIATLANIYYDVNGSERPNSDCRDRFKFLLYRNPDNNQYAVVQDRRNCTNGAALEINN